MYKFFNIIGLLISTFFVAQQVSIEAKINKNAVAINETFEIVYQFKIKGEAKSVTALRVPKLNNFEVVAEQNQTVQDNNTFNIIKAYTCRSKIGGNFTLAPASIMVDSKIYQSKSIQFTVKGITPNNNSPQNKNHNTDNQSVKFILSTNKTNLYEGEQVLVSMRLLFKDEQILNTIKMTKNGNFKNFTRKDIKEFDQHPVLENYQGETYKSIIVAQFFVAPIKSGTIVLDSFEGEYLQRIKIGDDLFGDAVYNMIPQNFGSNSLTFQVKPLPQVGKPASFTGAVGQFNIFLHQDKKQLKAGEKSNVALEIVGVGDEKLIQIPDLVNSFDAAFDVFPGKDILVSESKSTGNHVKVGKEMIAIPNYSGDYTIPAFEFSYFDPELEQYVTKKTLASEIKVLTGPTRPKNLTKKNKNDTVKTNEVINKWENISVFFSLALLLLIPLGVIIFRSYKKRKIFNQEQNVKNTHQRLVKKYLSEAKKKMNITDKNQFYNAIENAVFSFLADKFQLDRTKFSIQTVADLLKEKGIGDDKIQAISKILSRCNEEKYAPISADNIRKEIYEMTLNCIKSIS